MILLIALNQYVKTQEGMDESLSAGSLSHALGLQQVHKSYRIFSATIFLGKSFWEFYLTEMGFVDRSCKGLRMENLCVMGDLESERGVMMDVHQRMTVKGKSEGGL